MTTPRLLIMRHAKSDRTSNMSGDFDRPLNGRGMKDAASMGKWLRQQRITPDCIVSSPAIRAKQTILSVCRELAMDESGIIWDRRVYEADLDELLEVISEHGRNARCMLLTGHNPGLDSLVNHLSGDPPERNSEGKLMTTAAIAIMDFGGNPVSAKRKSAKLVKLVRPKEISKK